MQLTKFHDLIKPQWRALIGQLKLHGSLPVSDLSRNVEASYMGVKQQCEELKRLGYFERTRQPRTAVGRPEIFYSLSAKADELFPKAGVVFTLEMLDEVKSLYGENAPQKLFHSYFQKRLAVHQARFEKIDSIAAKLTELVKLREQDGFLARVAENAAGGLFLEEFHHPLSGVFEKYPHAVSMELRMLEQLLGVKLQRSERDGGRTGQPRVVFEVVPPSFSR